MHINIYIIYKFISFSVVKRKTLERGVKEEETQGAIFFYFFFPGATYNFTIHGRKPFIDYYST